MISSIWSERRIYCYTLIMVLFLSTAHLLHSWRYHPIQSFLKYSSRNSKPRLFSTMPFSEISTPISPPGASAVSPTTPLKQVYAMNHEELTEFFGGSGKAKIFWRDVRQGIDPLSEQGSLSPKAKLKLVDAYKKLTLVPNEIIKETSSEDGTRKLLLKLEDNLEIESVLIPTTDRTTLCVSTQIGCDRGCIFCSTGKMGIVRNLTSTEIIGQVIRGFQVVQREKMPELNNIVFMGMGDAGRNIDEVSDVVHALVDSQRLQFGFLRVTVSTVGPNPEIFSRIAALPIAMAWSLHSPNDQIRKKLVPSTKHSTIELRQGLIDGLLLRRNYKQRTMMIAVTLIDGINDSLDHADQIFEFVQPILTVSPKILINLLPYNDIRVPGLSRPSNEKVLAFQEYLMKKGIYCTTRITRGDDESAACGMLATKSRRKDLLKMQKQQREAAQQQEPVQSIEPRTEQSSAAAAAGQI